MEISLIGPKAADSFVLPLVAGYCVEWERIVYVEMDLGLRFEIQMQGLRALTSQTSRDVLKFCDR